jgi:hypothetical protein
MCVAGVEIENLMSVPCDTRSDATEQSQDAPDVPPWTVPRAVYIATPIQAVLFEMEKER